MKSSIAFVLACVLVAPPAFAQRAMPDAPPSPASAPTTSPSAKEILTDAAIIAVLIAASIAAYKAMGRPCACPDDVMRNGRRCGANSAYLKPGGYRPLCQVTDITPAMIASYRAGTAVPSRK